MEKITLTEAIFSCDYKSKPHEVPIDLIWVFFFSHGNRNIPENWQEYKSGSHFRDITVHNRRMSTLDCVASVRSVVIFAVRVQLIFVIICLISTNKFILNHVSCVNYNLLQQNDFDKIPIHARCWIEIWWYLFGSWVGLLTSSDNCFNARIISPFEYINK